MGKGSNGGDRGSVEDRRRRREWLLETYRADVDAAVTRLPNREVLGEWDEDICTAFGHTREPACRCYRCGRLLTINTMTVDRIVPGCQGGTYRRNNIRPACSGCQTITGNDLKAAMKK